jgi:hypothetical protein
MIVVGAPRRHLDTGPTWYKIVENLLTNGLPPSSQGLNDRQP